MNTKVIQKDFVSMLIIDFLPQMGKCVVYTMPRGFLGPVTLALAFPKGSLLRDRFDRVYVLFHNVYFSSSFLLKCGGEAGKKAIKRVIE